MKKITFILVASIFITTQLFAQGPKGREEQLKGLKIAHITQELDLSSEDALSDEEAAAIIDNFISIDTKIQKEKEHFYISLTGILSPKKILKLHIAEADFNRRILQRLRKEGKNRENKKE